MIKGKQIENNSITQNKLKLVTLSASTALATVDYVNKSGGTITTWSINNYDMTASVTLNNADLACITPIIDIPLSNIAVKLNGIEINIGGTTISYDAYFSPDDGITIRSVGTEQQGDKLYWNYSNTGYHLDETDVFDFIYLTKYVELISLELTFETDQISQQSVILKLK